MLLSAIKRHDQTQSRASASLIRSTPTPGSPNFAQLCIQTPKKRPTLATMSFGLSHGKKLDPALGSIGISPDELPPIPDEIVHDPDAARLDPRAWFSDPDRPFEIEIGIGKGTFLLQQAALESQTNFLGIEWAHEFYLYAADRCRRHQLANVRILHGNAVEFLRWRCPESFIRVIHLYFSDPWPKKRHHKNRVVQDRFLADAHRILVDQGELRIVTDHENYWHWMQEYFSRWTSDQGVDGMRFCEKPFIAPDSASTGELVGTNFERKYRKEGRPFYSCVLVRMNQTVS